MRRLTVPLVMLMVGCGGGGAGGDDDGGGPGDDAGPTVDGAVVIDSGSGGPDGTVVVGPGPSGCTAVVRDTATVAGTASDRFAWSDGDCKRRTASFAQGGGYLRQVTYDAAGQARTITGTGSNGWNGWGYIVMHYGNTAATTKSGGMTARVIMAGPHHALYELKKEMNAAGRVDATIHWLLATGRSNPIYSLTLDTTAAGMNTVNADSRAPYGDMDWDGAGNNEVEGVGWGDKFLFRTTGAGPVTQQSAWRYDQPNVMPHVLQWSTPANAEMGAVAVLPWAVKPAGGDYGNGVIKGCWQKTSASPDLGPSCRASGQTMLQDWVWPYQLNQYELPFVTNSRRLAWGLTFGAVGQARYTAFDQTLSGWPMQSYAVSMVLGRHAPSAVDAEVAARTAETRARLTATRGTVVTMGPGGAGRTDAVTWEIPGYDPAYGVWTVRAAGGATVVLDAPAAVQSPMVRVTEWAGATVTVKLGGRTLVPEVDYFATVDTASRSAWITLNSALNGRTELAIDP